MSSTRQETFTLSVFCVTLSCTLHTYATHNSASSSYISLFSNKFFILPVTTVWGTAWMTWTTRASTTPTLSATTRNSENGSRFVSTRWVALQSCDQWHDLLCWSLNFNFCVQAISVNMIDTAMRLIKEVDFAMKIFAIAAKILTQHLFSLSVQDR